MDVTHHKVYNWWLNKQRQTPLNKDDIHLIEVLQIANSPFLLGTKHDPETVLAAINENGQTKNKLLFDHLAAALGLSYAHKGIKENKDDLVEALRFARKQLAQAITDGKINKNNVAPLAATALEALFDSSFDDEPGTLGSKRIGMDTVYLDYLPLSNSIKHNIIMNIGTKLRPYTDFTTPRDPRSKHQSSFSTVKETMQDVIGEYVKEMQNTTKNQTQNLGQPLQQQATTRQQTKFPTSRAPKPQKQQAKHRISPQERKTSRAQQQEERKKNREARQKINLEKNKQRLAQRQAARAERLAQRAAKK